MSLLIRYSTSSNASPIQEQQKAKLHKRIRSTDSLTKCAFYGQERPVFVNGKIIKSSGVSLPKLSNSYLLKRGGSPLKTENGNVLDQSEEDVLLFKQQYSCSKRFDIGTAQTIGKRVYMEDTLMVKGELYDDIDFIGVFDGHNGQGAAIKSMHTFYSLIDGYTVHSDHVKDHLSKVFEQMHTLVSMSTESGTTASILLIRENDVIICRCGDSPIYVLTTDDEIMKVGKDHNLYDKDEVEMIKQNGGNIVNVSGVLRVNGKITITRSIGDKQFHPPLSCLPSIDIISLSTIKSILVASDGISVVSEDFLREILLEEFTSDIKAQCVRNNALEKDSKDNISVVVVQIRTII
ncbi:protein phosphatase domain containing protein [Entamoeba histolytica HM-1:IMSS-B]|uniref:Protein phosphatase domain-containing protein n=6 Tax=Entamoeba histolytica TaxID=5759 RepID=C4LZU0_ENTH1|nr:protein phosphatase domain-containing protein [Entamoeba histolytica HM-1:IMSS]EMD48194.1 Ca(2+)/calmodulindependent protein kinase phosphatase, putative [Entamoeba histolytica KU27]EMH72477.1 protein phosphatase domain containing protein [Entamoeba histolytica HM-1:IMSS-B]EMS13664.1 Ca(2+)/calmodulin-dependent protein kinase phosphatase [Entamoeba histolytica HM-3:IMSS]ENY65480.1 Ca(2+)/calmodulin-dependent protein kinase phosphatase, putative [Entamoeba histolytica HM-1:IMSS-A]GAT94399.1 |eukprot:XP_654712.2 protein phosphatase domain-containing protein [Entamoeba histolytica HM-1:IMSS]